jgi:hypothetical protein
LGVGAAVSVAGLAIGAVAPSSWWAAGEGRVFPAQIDYPNAAGELRVLLDGGPMKTRGHPFFAPIGPNGRACVTCHQPADAMSLSAETAQKRWAATGGHDPLFAAYDGSNCPSLPQGERASHSLLLDHGLIRIQRPWPPRTAAGEAIRPDFTLEVVRDPWGCNTGPTYGPAAAAPNVSVYRRPRPVANMKYLLAVGFAYDPKQGMPLPLDPESGRPMSGNLMADGRAGTLAAQMRDAAATHLEFLKRLSQDDIARITDFESRVYAAQQADREGGGLDLGGAQGGARNLAVSKAGQLGSIGRPVWSEFEAWETAAPGLTETQRRYRESVARGARLFREKTFLITDSALRRSGAAPAAVPHPLHRPAASALWPGDPHQRSGLCAHHRPLRRRRQDHPAVAEGACRPRALFLQRLGQGPAGRRRVL